MDPQAPSIATNLVPQLIAPPPTVETIDGVEQYLGQVGSMKDKELLALVKEIWGEAYKYQTENLEQVRAEVTGFLLDQRDLFNVILMNGSVAI